MIYDHRSHIYHTYHIYMCVYIYIVCMNRTEEIVGRNNANEREIDGLIFLGPG